MSKGKFKVGDKVKCLGSVDFRKPSRVKYDNSIRLVRQVSDVWPNIINVTPKVPIITAVGMMYAETFDDSWFRKATKAEVLVDWWWKVVKSVVGWWKVVKD